MKRLGAPVIVSVAVVALQFCQVHGVYVPLREYAGSTFFDGWDYWGNIDNTTWGNVTYLDQSDATARRLAYVNDAQHAIIKVDNSTTIAPASLVNRDSIRLTTKDSYGVGTLWIIDALHLPFGCSVWPSFWTLGANDQKQIEKILQLDILSIAARILVILSDTERRKELVASTQPKAQDLLNLLQALLDFPYLGAARPPIMNAAHELCKNSGLHPSSLVLRDVELEAENFGNGGSDGKMICEGVVRGHSVAIKIVPSFHAHSMDEILNAFAREAMVWRQLHHPNVLPFYGIHTSPRDNPSLLCLISPWMSNGNIIEYLARNPNADRVVLLLDVARSLEYLHTFDPPVIHGDLKGSNILITPSLKACVTGFGVGTLIRAPALEFSPTSDSRNGDRSLYRACQLRHHEEVEYSFKHHSKEENDQGNQQLFTAASDVYSFGFVCYEVFTGKPPFPDLFTTTTQAQTSKPPLMMDTLWGLVERCWQVEPGLRPTITDIVQCLDSSLDTTARGSSGEYICEWDEDMLSLFRSPLLEIPGMESSSVYSKELMETEHETLGSLEETSAPQHTDLPLCSNDDDSSELNILPPATPSAPLLHVETTKNCEWNKNIVPVSPALEVPLKVPPSVDPEEELMKITDFPNPEALSWPSIELFFSLCGFPPESEEPRPGPRQSQHTSPPLLTADQMLTITNEDTIIAVMGPTGTGKSTFVNTLMRHAVASTGDDLSSCTQEVRAFGYLHPNGSGRKVIIVDTPGFDDTEMTDYEVLQIIADWLEQTYRRQITLTGIFLFHSIAESRMRGTPLRNLRMFEHLCGANALGNVILTTTFWDRVSDEVGALREAQLKSEFWEPMIRHGSRVARFQPMTYESAWGLVGLFHGTMGRRRGVLKVQSEMVDEGKELRETSAFRVLEEWWARVTAKLKGILGGRGEVRGRGDR